MRIDEMNRAAKATAAQIFQDRAAGRSGARTAADHGDGARREELCEAIGRHFACAMRPLIRCSAATAMPAQAYCLHEQGETPLLRAAIMFCSAPDKNRAACI